MNMIKKLFLPSKKEKVESLQDKAYRIGNKFARLLVDKFDFDAIDVVAEDPKGLNLKSFIYRALVDNNYIDSVDSDIAVQQIFSRYTKKTSTKKYFITFELRRKYIDIIECRYLFAYVNDQEDKLIFLYDYEVNLFGHHEITPYIPDYGQFKFSSIYQYDQSNNELSNSTYIPLLNENNILKFTNLDANHFFPNYKTYLIHIKTKIIEQRFSKDATISIFYGTNILKSFECEITDRTSFESNLLKILFPFNLDDDQIKNLHLNRESLDNISECFDEQFENYELIRKMVKI